MRKRLITMMVATLVIPAVLSISATAFADRFVCDAGNICEAITTITMLFSNTDGRVLVEFLDPIEGGEERPNFTLQAEGDARKQMYAILLVAKTMQKRVQVKVLYRPGDWGELIQVGFPHD